MEEIYGILLQLHENVYFNFLEKNLSIMIKIVNNYLVDKTKYINLIFNTTVKCVIKAFV
jgi:hypothetical protein